MIMVICYSTFSVFELTDASPFFPAGSCVSARAIEEGSVAVPNRVVSHLMLVDSCSFVCFRQRSSTEMEADSIYFHVIHGL